MTGYCSGCHSEADHCHGTLLVHADGTVECTDPTCRRGVPFRHALVVSCQQVDGGCACRKRGPVGNG